MVIRKQYSIHFLVWTVNDKYMARANLFLVIYMCIFHISVAIKCIKCALSLDVNKSICNYRD